MKPLYAIIIERPKYVVSFMLQACNHVPVSTLPFLSRIEGTITDHTCQSRASKGPPLTLPAQTARPKHTRVYAVDQDVVFHRNDIADRYLPSTFPISVLKQALIARHYSNLEKITIIGDLAQLGPFAPPQPSEFSAQTKVSCIGRLVNSGVPYTSLDGYAVSHIS